MFKIHDAHEALTEHELTQVEEQLGFPLPAEFRDFLLTHNGGWPEPDTFPIEDHPSNDYARVHYFLCIVQGDTYNPLDWVRNFHFRGRVPAELLPVACTPGGNLVCLSVLGENAGIVYFWDHEEETNENGMSECDNVYYVAESFREFLNGLNAEVSLEQYENRLRHWVAAFQETDVEEKDLEETRDGSGARDGPS